jgi:hypothetical protein
MTINDGVNKEKFKVDYDNDILLLCSVWCVNGFSYLGYLRVITLGILLCPDVTNELGSCWNTNSLNNIIIILKR